MPKNQDAKKSVDILQLLKSTKERKKQKEREELRAQLDVEEFFPEGSITINEKTCRGIECKLCIKACPTNALYWKAGQIGITEQLCIYCGACVLSCIVDDCIKITRKRSTGEVEAFGNPADFSRLQHQINTRKRLDRIDEVKQDLPRPEKFTKCRRSKR